MLMDATKNIIPYVAYFVNPHPCIVMELAKYGSLHQIIHTYTVKLDCKAIKSLAYNICTICSFSEELPEFLHGDLHSKNILVPFIIKRIITFR